MKTTIYKNVLLAGLASAAFASCAPIKTQFSDRYAALGAVSEFEHIDQECEDGEVEAAIVADNAGNAFLVRSECKSLEEPEVINPEEVTSSPNGEEIEFREEIFELRDEGHSEESSGESREEEPSREQQDSNEERVAEVPRENTEVPRENTEVPKTSTEVPKPSTETRI